ncbi:MAG: DUF4190 domain-containing protein [Thermoleophilia bacterium]
MAPDPLRRAIDVVRAGLALAGVAGILVALSPLGDIVEGSGGGDVIRTATVDPSVGVIAGIGAALILAAAALRILWAHLLSLVLGVGLALVAAFLVIAARTSDDFADGADLSMGSGGLLLVAGFWLSLAGVVVALVGIRMVAQAAPPVTLEPNTIQRARTAPLAAILGIVGVVVVVTAGIAVAYGTLALGDIRSSGERLTGRGMATAGIVLGVLVLSLLAAIGGVGAWV